MKEAKQKQYDTGNGFRFDATLCFCFVIVVYVVKGQTIFAPTVSATNNSIILQAGGATVTISGPGSDGATGQTNGVPYSPVVTQAELQAFAAQISPQVYMSHL